MNDSEKHRDFERGTEGLRGLAALMVVYTHLLAPAPDVDPGYVPSSRFWDFEAAQGAVLLFFVLSGYVIGLTNRADFSGHALRDYGWRRLARIVPLYVLAVLLSVAVRPGGDAPYIIAGNLFFLQNELPIGNWHLPVISANTNLWSLNYEMLYYVLFPLVWFVRERWVGWLLGTLAVSIVGWFVPVFGPTLTSYAAGWTFWLAGYALSRTELADPSKQWVLPWPSLLLLWLTIWKTKPLWSVCHRFGLLPMYGVWMNFSYYDFILPCLCLMMAASGRRPRGWRWLTGFTLALPILYLLWRLGRGQLAFTQLSPADMCVPLAAVLWFWRPSPAWFARLAPVGAISYAIYIFQRPVQWFVRDHLSLPSGDAGAFALRAALIVMLTFAVAYFAEKILQPRIRSWLETWRASRNTALV